MAAHTSEAERGDLSLHLKSLHLMVDNYGTHTHPNVEARLGGALHFGARTPAIPLAHSCIRVHDRTAVCVS